MQYLYLYLYLYLYPEQARATTPTDVRLRSADTVPQSYRHCPTVVPTLSHAYDHVPAGRVTVYLFLPNLIGYARIVLALVGYAVALKDHQTMLLCYMGSQFLDAIDGLAARMLGQSSQFGAPGPLTHAGDTRLRCVAHVCAGAVLDMVTDRASTACLCIVLGALYPQYVAGFCSLIMLDLFSHWCGGPRGASICLWPPGAQWPSAGTTPMQRSQPARGRTRAQAIGW